MTDALTSIVYFCDPKTARARQIASYEPSLAQPRFTAQELNQFAATTELKARVMAHRRDERALQATSWRPTEEDALIADHRHA